jgi:hypothetical protein
MSNIVNHAINSIGNIGKSLEKTAESVGSTFEKVANGAAKIIEDISKNPLPIIETIALTAALGPAGAGLSTAVAGAAAGAAVTAANGGDPKQILTGLATGAVGSEVASNVVGGGAPITSGAVSSAVSGGLNAATQGKDVVKGIEKGAATGGLTSGIEQGLLATKTPEVNYDITTGQNLPKVGFDVLQDTTAFNADGTPNTNLFAPTGTDVSLKGQSSTDVFNPDGSANYDILQPGSGGGEGLKSTSTTVTDIPYIDPSLNDTEKILSKYVAQDIIRQSGLGKSSGGSSTDTSATNPASSSGTSAVSNAALGSQQSPNAATGADIANIDPQGLGAKEGKIGGKYPWGEPEGTTKLKDEGQVV